MPFVDTRRTKNRASLALILFTSVLLGALSLAAYAVIGNYREQSLHLIESARQDELATLQRVSKEKVKLCVDLINAEIGSVDERLRLRINTKVNEAYSLARTMYNQMRRDHRPEDIGHTVTEVLRDIHWDGGAGFFFVDTLDGRSVLMPTKPALEGLNVLEVGLPEEKVILQDIIDLARESGSGFLEYDAVKERGGVHKVRKLTYIRTFDPLGWIIGTGAYPDEAMARTKIRLRDKLEELNRSNPTDSYLFVIDFSHEDMENYGRLLLGDNPSLTLGMPIPKSTRDPSGRAFLEEALAGIRLRGEAFVRYATHRPSTGKIEEKMSYFRWVPKLNWLISTGFYMPEVEEAYQARVKLIRADSDRKIFIATNGLIALIIIAIVVIGLVISHSSKIADEKRKLVQQLLDAQTNLVFLTDGAGMIACNKGLLRTMGFSSIEHFKEKHSCICELFLQADGFLTNRKGVWLEEVGSAEANGEVAKALIFDRHRMSRRVLMVRIGDEILDNKYVTVSLADITEAEKTKQQLNRYVTIVDEFVQTSSTDLEGNITYVSNALCKSTGYDKDELMGQNHRILRHPDMPSACFEDMWATITKGQTWNGEVKNKRKDGGECWTQSYISPIFDEIGECIGYTAIRHDITAQKKIEQMTITDVMTGLSNRRHFNDVISHELNLAKRKGRRLAFFMVDVDHFKQYNDTYGHQAGDEALRAVGETMLERFRRSGEYTFRLGGEEFGVLLTDVEFSEAEQAAEGLRAAITDLRIPHEYNDCHTVLTVSIGVLFLKANLDVTEDKILLEADKALYKAKGNGRNCVVFHQGS